MYDPPLNENYDEWIEIYNNENSTISLENWTVCNDSILPGYLDHRDSHLYNNFSLDLPSGTFAVITDGGTGTLAYSDFSPSGMALHTSTSYICGGLNNPGDVIVFSNITDSFSVEYNSSMGASNNNMSLCLAGSFFECMLTPGAPNSLITNPDISVNHPLQIRLDDPFYFNVTCNVSGPFDFEYSITGPLDISGNFSGNLQCPMSLGPVYFFQAGDYNASWNLTTYGRNLSNSSQISVISDSPPVCPSLSVKAPFVANVSQQFSYFIDINASCDESNYTIEYRIEDVSGNIVKSRMNTTQSVVCSKSVAREWTPSAAGAYMIIAESDCSASSAVFGVKGDATPENSYIKIISHDVSAKFGDAFPVELEIYRGSTNKYAIEIWIEYDGTKSSQVATLHAKNKFSLYHLMIPLQLKVNCDSHLKDGLHSLIVSGLDQQINSSLFVSGPSEGCQIVENQVKCPSCSASAPACTDSKTKNITIGLEIVAFNQTVFENDTMITAINITNAGKFKNASIYSYVFRESSLASEGGWIPNAKDFQVNDTALVFLENRIKQNVSEGLYYLRVRLKTDKTYDKTAEIIVRRNPVSPILEGDEAPLQGNGMRENKTSSQASRPIPVTAAASSREIPKFYEISSPFLNYVLNFNIFSLFNLLANGIN